MRVLQSVLGVLLWSFSWAHKNDGGYRDHPDRMHTIPGLAMPPPSPWYSGYLTYELNGHTIHTHYILVEAEEGEEDKPLLYWSNGGPGASSTFGLMTELGPLLFSELSLQTDHYRKTGIPTPIYNEYSWTKLGHVLIFDLPAPVGFSYCEPIDDSVPEGYTCGSWTDELASLNAYQALIHFYQKFPSYLDKDLYLTGESYAGIYIPTLARRIVEGTETAIQDVFRGFAVGDGCLGTETNVCGDQYGKDYFYNAIFLAGHHQMPLSTLHSILTDCGLEGENLETTACKESLHKGKTQAGGYYAYSLYDDCTYDNGFLMKNTGKLGGALNDYPCGGDPVMTQYLNLTVVKEAFHVAPGVDFFNVDNGEAFDYTSTEPTLENFYKSVNGQLRVLVYNGDTDPSINSFEAQNWTHHLGFDVEEDWRPWTIDGCLRMGGYVTRYAGDFDFLTIRGSGHMVPTYKPAATFAFLKAWLENTDYPAFDPTCWGPEKMPEQHPRDFANDETVVSTPNLLRKNQHFHEREN